MAHEAHFHFPHRHREATADCGRVARGPCRKGYLDRAFCSMDMGCEYGARQEARRKEQGEWDMGHADSTSNGRLHIMVYIYTAYILYRPFIL